MRIAVTGARGRIGRHVAADLRKRGAEVTAIDRVPSPDPYFDPSLTVDLTDYGAVVAGLHGCEAIVHLGANPWPDLDFPSGAERFANNSVGTFNVFQAAAQLSVRRVVWASSETVMGFPFDRVAPVRVPIQEDDPAKPQCAYAISKLALEGVATQMAALHGTTLIGLRLAHVVYPASLGGSDYAGFVPMREDPEARQALLWKYVDVRDVLGILAAALEAPVSGALVVNVAAADTMMDTPTRELVASAFPKCDIHPGIERFGTTVDLSRARTLFGWEPRVSWRQEPV